LGRLNGSIQTLSNPDLFVYMNVRKEAVLSSQMEGTQSSLQDVLAAEVKIVKRRLNLIPIGSDPLTLDSRTGYVARFTIGSADARRNQAKEHERASPR
jgi:hypothetical protein